MAMLQYMPDIDERYMNRFDKNGSSAEYWERQISRKEGMIKGAVKEAKSILKVGLLKGVLLTVASIVVMKFFNNGGEFVKIWSAMSPVYILMNGISSCVEAKKKFAEAEVYKEEIHQMQIKKECDEAFTL